MNIKFSRYKLLDDFKKVCFFLDNNYNLETLNGYLLKPFYEYAHTHDEFNHKLSHLKRLAIPTSIGLLFNTMYNVVDSFWAGKLSTDSLASLALNFPLYLLVISLGVGFSAASGALIANAIGAREVLKSRKYLSQSIISSTLFSLFIAVLFLIILEPIFILLKAEGPVLKGAIDYGRVIILGMPIINLVPVLSSALSSRGDTKSYRNILIIGFLLNIGLDPLFMYALSLNEAGVALATVLIQFISLLYLLYKVIKIDGLKELKKEDYIPEKEYIKEIVEQAVPATANYVTMSLGTFVITWFIAAFGSNAVAAYGAAIRVEQIALVPAAGLNVALGAMVGQNNGAKKIDRVIISYKLSLLGGFIVMIIILPPVLIFGQQIIGLFTNNKDVIRMGYDYLLLQGITFYSYIILFQSNALLQGIKKPRLIMWMGLYRQILAPAIIFYILCFALSLEERGVWIGLIFINWSSALITLAWTLRKLKKL
ncbi:MATE family efflux transporter [Thiospirochaeta perfilievii]|uniref:Multidrug-efflux transporter n=1 Tax=Thiospirochaeta perfilievii TaxID=252967 RepID=A0A5C1QCR1_9SPIO|nr:MATE family efflux transporter [Thiospirochaeta perfilievii]QEN05331.1 MATE family efflux transporter [Thiospirochaeta perfilievii]